MSGFGARCYIHPPDAAQYANDLSEVGRALARRAVTDELVQRLSPEATSPAPTAANRPPA
jgi:hypothetical protein